MNNFITKGYDYLGIAPADKCKNILTQIRSKMGASVGGPSKPSQTSTLPVAEASCRTPASARQNSWSRFLPEVSIFAADVLPDADVSRLQRNPPPSFPFYTKARIIDLSKNLQQREKFIQKFAKNCDLNFISGTGKHAY